MDRVEVTSARGTRGIRRMELDVGYHSWKSMIVSQLIRTLLLTTFSNPIKYTIEEDIFMTSIYINM